MVLYTNLPWQIDHVGADELWNLPTKKSVTVAVLDTGIDLNHKDLNIWTNSKEIPNNGIDDDNNGYIDDVHGYDFNLNNPNVASTSWHGTNVAGVIGATGEFNPNVKGIFPGVEIMPLKIFGNNSVIDAAVEAIDYAIANKVDVINNSWITYGDSSVLKAAVQRAVEAGIVVVGGAGNDNSLHRTYPSSYDGVLSVAATNKNQDLVSNSNYGEYVQIGAPGAQIATTAPGNTYTFNFGASSAASAIASGAAALMLAKDNTLSGKEAVKKIIHNVTSSINLTDKVVSGGVLNIEKAFNSLGDNWVTGTIYHDKNGNNKYDVGEPLLKGIVWDDLNNNLFMDKDEFRIEANGQYRLPISPEGIHNINAKIFSYKNNHAYGTTFQIKEKNGNNINANNLEQKSDVQTLKITSDNQYHLLKLPFKVHLFSKASDTFKVTENGFLVEGTQDIKDWAGKTYVNSDLKNSYYQSGVIAPFWDDLIKNDDNPKSDILYWENEDKTKAIVQWNHFQKDIPFTDDNIGDFTFQVQFLKDKGMNFKYFKMEGDLNSATIGLNSCDNLSSKILLYNSPDWINGNIIQFRDAAAPFSTITSAENINFGGI